MTAQLANLENVKIIVPMTGSTPVSTPAASLKSITWIVGMDDTVIGYDSAPIKGGGHLSVTDLCQQNKQVKNAVDEAQADNVCGVEAAVIIGLPALNDCGPGTLPWMKGVEIVN